MEPGGMSWAPSIRLNSGSWTRGKLNWAQIALGKTTAVFITIILGLFVGILFKEVLDLTC